jgi:hypothetical protein
MLKHAEVSFADGCGKLNVTRATHEDRSGSLVRCRLRCPGKTELRITNLIQAGVKGVLTFINGTAQNITSK